MGALDKRRRYVVFSRSSVYHIWSRQEEGVTVKLGLCGATGILHEKDRPKYYRSGHNKPHLTDVVPIDRRLCAKCKEKLDGSCK